MAIPESQVAVVMVPLPAQGHLNQLLNLSRIISAAGIPSTTSAAPPTSAKQSSESTATGTLHGFIRSHSQLPLSTTLHPTPTPKPNSRFSFFHHSLLPHISDTLFSHSTLTLYQMSSPIAFEAYRLTVYSYYWEAAGRPDLPAGARILKEIPTLDGLFPPEFAEFEDLQMNSRKNFSGDIFNSSRVIEECEYVAEKIWAKNERHKCLEWLDKQEVNSVIFVSFGTTSSLSDEQIQEVAFGLERSGHKFIWVVRDADKGDIFAGEVREAELPEGFEERVRERGVIVRDWAPQLEILGHCSTGGFMSHCGWNSCTESISMGVPIAAWPMHSDQPGNAFLVTKVLRIGVEVVDWGRRDGVVSSERVENAVRKLMGTEEGDEMRRRAQELGVGVKNSLMKDGRSKEMDLFITHIIR
ncbi:hypothetical protein ACS0TY_030962 [Phlomoides rotata]